MKGFIRVRAKGDFEDILIAVRTIRCVFRERESQDGKPKTYITGTGLYEETWDSLEEIEQKIAEAVVG